MAAAATEQVAGVYFPGKAFGGWGGRPGLGDI
jgi:hypothetical protein